MTSPTSPISKIAELNIVQKRPMFTPSRLKRPPIDFRFPEAPLRKGESFGGVVRRRWQAFQSEARAAGHA